MKQFFEILGFAKNYRNNVIQNILFNFLTSLFSLFSFAAIAPFLAILFKTIDQNVVKPEKFVLSSQGLLNQMNYFLSTYVAENGSEAALLLFCGVIIFMFLLKNATTYFATYHLAKVRSGVVRDIRKAIYNKVLQLPMSFFTTERKGNILSKSTNDIQEIEKSILGALEMVFRDPPKFFLYLITLFIMSWKLTLFVIILLPISGFLISRIAKSLKRKAKRGQSKLGDVLTLLEETLSGIRIIKAFNAESEIGGKFNKENDTHFRINTKIQRRQALASPLSEFMGAILISLILWFGGRMVLSPEPTLTGEFFITFIVIFSQLISPAKSFSTAFFKIQKGAASLDRIKELLQEDLKVKEVENPKTLNDFSQTIEFKNVNFKYDQELVLKNVNLKINKGEMVALVGPSGGGKSTLADMLPRFYDPTDGEILIDGENLKNLKIEDIRNQMGIVTQESILFNDSVFNNITLGSDETREEPVIEAAKIANAHEFIAQSKNGYNSKVGERGGKLSGGQRQRISIARAVFKNPPILILDEATSALDTESEKQVQEALDNLMENRTTLVIAHRLSTIQHADKIVVIENGEIVQVGKHDELVTQEGVYKKLFDLQSFA
jgi:ATP-binding cassette, subfamily B, bacterial MsbA